MRFSAFDSVGESPSSNEDGGKIPKWPKNSDPKALDIRELTGETAVSVDQTMDSSVPLQARIAPSVGLRSRPYRASTWGGRL